MPRERTHETNAERQKAYRERTQRGEVAQGWFERGKALLPSPPSVEKENVAAWCDGLWLTHATLQAEDRAVKYAELARKS